MFGLALAKQYNLFMEINRKPFLSTWWKEGESENSRDRNEVTIANAKLQSETEAQAEIEAQTEIKLKCSNIYKSSSRFQYTSKSLAKHWDVVSTMKRRNSNNSI